MQKTTMPTKAKKRVITLGDVTHTAIQKHFKKSIKHEADVLADEDPEFLHQMRVGMRRLRGALQVFEFAADLPQEASVQRIRNFARILGAVRDLDVLEIELNGDHHSDLPKAEKEELKNIRKALRRNRSKHFDKLESMVQSSKYEAFKQGLEDWLASPKYQPIAQLSIETVLPDLLLPLICQVFLHPAWLIGIQVDSGKKIRESLTPKLIRSYLNEQGYCLHDLRKQMKRVRYQTELFVDFYDEDYKIQAEEFKTIQEVLGQIQDSTVLQSYLQDELKISLEKVCPTFAKSLDQKIMEAWQTWRSLQEKYLDPDSRSQARLTVLKPILKPVV